jgi:hypothetical protein
MRRRTFLTLLVAGFLVILGIYGGLFGGSLAKPSIQEATPSPAPPQCTPEQGEIPEVPGITFETSGTPVPEVQVPDTQGETGLFVQVIQFKEVEKDVESSSLCYPGQALFRVDSGTIEITVEGGCVFVFPSATAIVNPFGNGSGCKATDIGQGSTASLSGGDAFLGKFARLIITHRAGPVAVIVVSAVGGYGGCGHMPCP